MHGTNRLVQGRFLPVLLTSQMSTVVSSLRDPGICRPENRLGNSPARGPLQPAALLPAGEGEQADVVDRCHTAGCQRLAVRREG